MTIKVTEQGNCFLLYPESESGLSVEFFDPVWLEQNKFLQAKHDRGRGSVYFFARNNCEYVLRQYRRGGAIAKITQSDYLWHGLIRSRAYRELDLLEMLVEEKLPVSRPFAALVRKSFHTYQASLITYRLTETVTFSDFLKRKSMPELLWHRIGSVIRQFHDKNVYHSDLNANNILINGNDHVFLIDFDKSYIRRNSRFNWKELNLHRLHRSLIKHAGQYTDYYYTQTGWDTLLKGYSAGIVKH